MCDAMMEILKDRIDVLRKKSWEDGALQGRLEGKIEGKIEGIRLMKTIMKMYADGVSYENIAEKCQITLEEVTEILNV